MYGYRYSLHKHNCQHVYSEHRKLQRLPVVANRELYKAGKIFNKNKTRVKFKHLFQTLSVTSELQWSSCNANHDEHLGINKNTKE